jgi:hypothetical protein
VDFLDALAQTVVGVAGLASLNHYASDHDWPKALLTASVFMVCYWLGRYSADRLSRGGWSSRA